MNQAVRVDDSPIEGTGVFAAVEFAAGDPILAIDDSCVVTNEEPLRDDEDERYCDYPDGEVVLMQPPERYINHGCDPNAYVRSIGDTRYVLARRDVTVGEEITYDYRINGHGETTWECHCGSDRCSGTVHADFFELPRRRQLEYLPLLDCWFVETNGDRLEELVRVDG